LQPLKAIKLSTSKETYPSWETQPLTVLDSLLSTELLEYKYIIKVSV
jgi:hypothetical protein